MDWGLGRFNFGPDNSDFDGYVSSNAYFGDENSHSGGTGGVRGIGLWPDLDVTKGRWTLLYVMLLGSSGGSSANHGNGAWFAAGGCGESTGKQCACDWMPVSHVGFSVNTDLSFAAPVTTDLRVRGGRVRLQHQRHAKIAKPGNIRRARPTRGLSQAARSASATRLHMRTRSRPATSRRCACSWKRPPRSSRSRRRKLEPGGRRPGISPRLTSRGMWCSQRWCADEAWTWSSRST